MSKPRYRYDWKRGEWLPRIITMEDGTRWMFRDGLWWGMCRTVTLTPNRESE